MTPKEQYEARKAERQAQRDAHGRGRSIQQDRDDQLDFMDLADRFVAAAERIADALELSNKLVTVTVGDITVKKTGGEE